MVKDVTRKNLLLVRKRYGVDNAIAVAEKALKLPSSKKDFHQQFNGEVCEVVLEMLLDQAIKERHHDWYYSKSVIIPDTESMSEEFLTEIDFVVFTPQCVFCIECKSYAGKKTLIEDGTIIYGNKRRDVYKQNLMHLELLRNLLNNFSKTPRYQMILFNFSHGEIMDKREKAAITKFPLTSYKNVITCMELITKNTNKVWDMVGLKHAKLKLDIYSDNNRERHLHYVQSLHHEEDDK